jgi:hypothetical protein
LKRVVFSGNVIVNAVAGWKCQTHHL